MLGQQLLKSTEKTTKTYDSLPKIKDYAGSITQDISEFFWWLLLKSEGDSSILMSKVMLTNLTITIKDALQMGRYNLVN